MKHTWKKKKISYEIMKKNSFQVNQKTAGNVWMRTQHCRYRCPSDLAAPIIYSLYWSRFMQRYTTLKKYRNTFWKQMPRCLKCQPERESVDTHNTGVFVNISDYGKIHLIITSRPNNKSVGEFPLSVAIPHPDTSCHWLLSSNHGDTRTCSYRHCSHISGHSHGYRSYTRRYLKYSVVLL